MRVDGGSWADYTHERFLQLCHYGAVGDRLWVREAWRVTSKLDDISPNQLPEGIGVEYPATRHINNLEGRKRPSIHMPRSLSRILTEVTDIRVQRLQDITPEEAKAEGLKCMSKDGLTVKFGIPDLDGYPGTDNHGWPWQEWEFDPVMAYKRLWEKINGKGSWDKNPWFGSLNSEKYNNANRKPVPERRRYQILTGRKKQNAADRMAAQEWRATLRKHGWPRRCAKNSNHRNTATGSKTNRMETGDS